VKMAAVDLQPVLYRPGHELRNRIVRNEMDGASGYRGEPPRGHKNLRAEKRTTDQRRQK